MSQRKDKNLKTGLQNRVKKQKDRIFQLRNRYQTIFNHSEQAVIVWNRNLEIIDWNNSAEDLFGWSKEEMINENLIDVLINDEDRNFVESLLDKNLDNLKTKSIHKIKTKTGKIVCCEWHNIPVTDFNSRVIEVLSVIKECLSSELKGDNLVYYDPLTEIYNRRYYEEELKRLNTSRQLPLSIILADVNRLKLTNDIFGHQQGDKLLKEVAEIINSSTRVEDIIARWGGDEFGILLPNTNTKETKKIMRRIKMACHNSSLKPIPPNISLGAATKRSQEEDINKIFNQAESRMYEDKEEEKSNSEDEVLNNLLEYLDSKIDGVVPYNKVVSLAEKFGRKVGLDEYELEKLTLLARYHDIGKVGIPEKILNKQERLTNEEWEEYLRHLPLGYDIAKSFSTLTPIADEILYHHESWNGTGYPQQLTGEEIPVLARMIYIVSYYYELITSVDCGMKMNVSCKFEYTEKEALEKIERYAGSLFDPKLVEEFLELFNF
ncbi:diguanylate cyclase domain-containing protein [Halanaerobacter jeridensis]|uniref:Diguanylate cyclase (GGDEF)-like protein/PAS domain S-box-containing protein n=1 Tax=Halanaerobacter jeridensis TaxID=706427 RepID=A0A939BTA6_9FIRM|nr:diguanylate cyclase [Halanaerobacter jeridensis]MBM7558051.1 diguanylate cyclase (GGDEF)-like protein/PAS domain S-box-containing protein [Halanaerobacter jeridensis]